MNYTGNKVENLKIAYIGGGSRGWAWGLMSDLASADDISGEVWLYDIDFEAAKKNEIIGNKSNETKGCKSAWKYKAVSEIEEALRGADFVIVSILPGTFAEMNSDVHTPEKYGIYQSVGDTLGPGGIIRALRTIPMFEEIALAIQKHCPNAWVINYTNPMAICIRTLYRTFPEIKAFGCCHEVFGTQKLLVKALKEFSGIDGVIRKEIMVNVVGINHFTWLTKAHYRDIDIFPIYREFCEKYYDDGYGEKADTNWMNNFFESRDRVKMDLFLRFGLIAAAGDRHLAEFCPGHWYLKNPDQANMWKFGLTPVSWRKDDLVKRLEKSEKLVIGEEEFELKETGEEGVTQIRALLGLCNIVTNVNIPNTGQIPNLPKDAIVETNAVFRSGILSPVLAGDIPDVIQPLISHITGEQEIVVEAGIKRNLDLAFEAFAMDNLVTISLRDARMLFNEMVKNTQSYLTDY